MALVETTRLSCSGGTDLLDMIIEHFKNRDPVAIYRRFRDRGRLAPEGLQYVSSWVDLNLERCIQLMETEHPERSRRLACQLE
jgi:hypothetical protein